MSLERYHQKRDFGKTPEPRGKLVAAGKQLSFFIQKHHARRLHYDFRLELDGTLKSWALPKGPSLDPGHKRLAVHVEDHPLEYGTFEGEIPAKQYGAGTVLVWDRGIWLPQGDPLESYRKGHMKFTLLGEKLAGGWALVRMGQSDEKKDNWLLIKERDAHAVSGSGADITVLQPDSVMGGDGTRQKVATARAAKSKPTAVQAKVANTTGNGVSQSTATTGTKSGAAAASVSKLRAEMAGKTESLSDQFPAAMTPQLATLAAKAPDGPHWLSEVKFDGYRALCRLDQGTAKLVSRNGNDWTKKWQVIATAGARLPARNAWLDGEVVAIDKQGRINFQLLQNLARKGVSARLAYYVFDLLYLNGQDVRAQPLIERKRRLQALLDQADVSDTIIFSEHLVGDAADVFAHACRHALEGIMCKRGDAPYTSGRNRDWLKLKCQQRQEFVIGGYTDPAGEREHFGALLLGFHDDQGRLTYAGRVGTGFDQQLLSSLSKKMKKLERKTSPFDNPPSGRDLLGVQWVQPSLVAEVKFAQWTEAGVIRHASFVGLRSDKPAGDIRREQAVLPEATALPAAEVPTTTRPDKPTGRAKRAKAQVSDTKHGASDAGAPITLAGVRLTHPGRILFPDTGLTKLQLAQYYQDVADWILPDLVGRPLTLVRCPHGDAKPCFFQKHAGTTVPNEIGRIQVPGGGADISASATSTYMTADTLEALLGLVQMGVLELHTWGARGDRLQQPDRIIFDLDPAPDVAWEQVVEAAQLIRGLMQEIGLTSFVKTTGGKGLHVVLPIKPEHNWDTVKHFSRAVAEHMAEQLPDRFTASMSKAKRGGKVFIDYLRNAAEATAIAAYSTRARPGAPVAVPIEWEELTDQSLRSNTFTVSNVRQRLDALKRDPWAAYFTSKQRLGTKALRLFGVPPQT